MTTPSFAPCRDLDAPSRLAAAALAVEALQEFYERLPFSHEGLLACVADEFVTEGSELGDAVAALQEGVVVGLFAGYPADAQAERQQQSVFHCLSRLDPDKLEQALAVLDEHRRSVPTVPAGSFYLARIAVASAQRGTGLAGKVLDAFHRAGAGHAGLSLHVRADNRRAIAFYRKNGFALAGTEGMNYQVMSRAT